MRAIVLIGTANGFSGGADIREFGTPWPAADPASAHPGRASLKTCAKPVIAADRRGSPWAAASSLRSAATTAWHCAGARIAFPEVKLGLLPGAGGTQRLPRLIGLERALEHDRLRR